MYYDVVSVVALNEEVQEIVMGVTLTGKESMAQDNLDLQKFFGQSKSKSDGLSTDFKKAREMYSSTLEFFGEDKRTEPSDFFGPFLFLIYTKIETNNEQYRPLDPLL